MTGPNINSDNYGSDATREYNSERKKQERAEQEELRRKEEEEARKLAGDVDRERELAPIKKALRDEVDFLGQKYSSISKIGGRGLF